MTHETVDTVVVGAGQAGLAMSAHLKNAGIPHVVLERERIAERWRTARWDSLVANGPAWHDRFPVREFDGFPPDGFTGKDRVADYFEAFARQIAAPVRTGVEVTRVTRQETGPGFVVETSEGTIEALNVVAATGPFQRPVIPPMIPESAGFHQLHSNAYRNPEQLPRGGVLVVGAGSSGTQIADELLSAGRDVWLSIGPHNRPPRAYRGLDFCWWLGVLGEWDVPTLDPATAHITIAVSGADGGHTVDFRKLAERGMHLVGMTQSYADGSMRFADDLATNIRNGDANYLGMLERADAYARDNGLDLPEEPEAKIIRPDPACMIEPVLELDLAKAGISTILWATGYALDFAWLKAGALDGDGKPVHHRGVSDVPGIYFLGLPWLSRRASSFIWGVWHDAKFLADHIDQRRKYLAFPESRSAAAP